MKYDILRLIKFYNYMADFSWFKSIITGEGVSATQRIISNAANKITNKIISPNTTTPAATADTNTMVAVTMLQSGGLMEQPLAQIQAITGGILPIAINGLTTWYSRGAWLIVVMPTGRYFAGNATPAATTMVNAAAKQMGWLQGVLPETITR